MIKMRTFLIVYIFALSSCVFDYFTKAAAEPKVGGCDPEHGLLAYFDIRKCSQEVQSTFKPIAFQYIQQEPYAYGPVSPEVNLTICLPDGFNGKIIYTSEKDGYAIQSVNLQTIAANQTLQAFYQSRPDDKAFQPGTGTVLPALPEALLKDARFADTHHDSPALNSDSTPNTVLQSNQIHNAIYLTYCGLSS